MRLHLDKHWTAFCDNPTCKFSSTVIAANRKSAEQLMAGKGWTTETVDHPTKPKDKLIVEICPVCNDPKGQGIQYQGNTV